MSGITVIVVPTWAVWIFTALAVVNIVQHVWKIALLKQHAHHEPPDPTVRRLACWWFGCWPEDYEALRHDCEAIPCKRCGAADTSYSDRVGDTRHARMVDRLRRLRWRLLDSWRPQPCPACGERKCKPDCDGIPF